MASTRMSYFNTSNVEVLLSEHYTVTQPSMHFNTSNVEVLRKYGIGGSVTSTLFQYI